MYSGMRSTEPISPSIFSAASLAPPWAGPHRHAIPAAMQANGFAPEDPATRTGLAQHFLDHRVPQEADLLVLEGAFLHDFGSTELVTPVHHGDMRRKPGEKQCLLHGRIPTAYHYHL